jgi:quercetin dioxygenase-like cupin family protein
MEFLTEGDFKRLSNPGVVSLQLVSPHNSQSARVTITRVTVQPGAGQPRHKHDGSEQIWLALEGAATLLLGEGATWALKAGEVARFADGDIHGVDNTGSEPFVYLAVTSPPINFDYAYRHKS